VHDLNYQHLHYFWTVVREGTVTAASRKLRRAQPTVTAQLRALEEAMGQALFERRGRHLVPTATGRMVYRYADEIFSLGAELVDALQGSAVETRMRFAVGVTEVLPKLVAHRLLEPALRLAAPIHLVCDEGATRELLTRLSVHELDLVLSDAPIGTDVHVRAYNHLLGECGVTFFASTDLAQRLRPGFPRSLHGAPVLLPPEGTALRRSLVRWFDSLNVQPHVTGEFTDSALLKTFGQMGMGTFCGPQIIDDETRRMYRVEVVGRTEEVRERFYAISVQRKVSHPAVLAIAETARGGIFGIRA
jgi:LysR family transcriptional regulator, transcriptional activator of nhaA